MPLRFNLKGLNWSDLRFCFGFFFPYLSFKFPFLSQRLLPLVLAVSHFKDNVAVGERACAYSSRDPERWERLGMETCQAILNANTRKISVSLTNEKGSLTSCKKCFRKGVNAGKVVNKKHVE